MRIGRLDVSKNNIDYYFLVVQFTAQPNRLPRNHIFYLQTLNKLVIVIRSNTGGQHICDAQTII